MEGTLLIGDHLLVNKFIFGGSGAWYEKVLPYRRLERGDIIVFKYPYADHQHFVKRVIGLPGDRLKLVDQAMYVNGKPLNEPYVVHDATAPYDNFNYSFPPGKDQMISPQVVPESRWRNELRRYVQGDELVVPPGKIFAMGDNRDRSSDQPLLGIRGSQCDHGASVFDLLVGGRHQQRLHANHFSAAAGRRYRNARSPSGSNALGPYAAHRALKWADCFEKAGGKRAFGTNHRRCEAASPVAFHLQSSLRNFRTT